MKIKPKVILFFVTLIPIGIITITLEFICNVFCFDDFRGFVYYESRRYEEWCFDR